ncbi:beta and beta-prime subunits of DNA dependent RNA-polymerase (apicoplast) [Babesia gibsoni]|uniref:DNA-directed RNA polymerase n=1 Tax=Babesia gibsoni TaxID=33632 RepID=A0AAD8LLJ9_BABGI|nr:beta and beta-prime subunits of DNA dependent RNA-polymerase [Babesia gibsoni]
MGSKMHTQTLPLIYSNNQYVYTKYNKINNLLLNKYIISKHIGIVIEVTNYKIIILDNKNRFINYYLCPYTINDYNSYIYYKPIVWKGGKITIGKILATPSDINNFEFTLGINNIINYSFYYGYEHEDSIILNKKLVFNNTLTFLFFNINEVNLYNIDNIYIDILCIYNTFLYKILYSAYTKLIKNKHIFSKKIFFKKKRGKKQKLFFKYTYIYNIKTSLDRLIKYEYLFNNSLNKLFLNKFIYLNLKLFLVNINNINIGDKLCGRHGNKGTIAKIIDFIDTPYTSKDFYPYIITSPIGALSRMNIGQFLEGFCGNLGYNNNIRFKAPIELINSNIYIKSLYNYFNNIYIDLYSKYLSKKIFRDFKTGYKLKNFTYCVLLYYFKLMHTSKTKFRYKSYNKHIIQQQIFKDVLNSDQKFGEMEIWSLEAYGAAYNIKELSLIKSNYKFLQNSINKSDHIYSKIFKCLLLELKSILINIKFNKYYSTINNFYKININ